MRTAMVVALALLATLVTSGFASTVPAFIWSPGHRVSNEEVTGVVNYQTVSAKDLAKAVLTQGQWSQLLCSEKKLQQHADLGLVFVGREDSFMKSNLSLAFPYVAASGDESMESSLVSAFT